MRQLDNMSICPKNKNPSQSYRDGFLYLYYEI